MQRSLALFASAALVVSCANIDPAAGIVSVSLGVDPARSVYSPMQMVTVTMTGLDESNMPRRISNATWTVEPASGAMHTGGGHFTLTGDGTVRIRGCIDSNHGPLCASTSLLVDSAPPQLEVTSPLPGAELGGPGETAIEVRGVVTDTHFTSVFVNGQAATMGAGGMFTARVTPTFGVQHLDVVASDGVYHEVRRELDVLWAGAYTPATNAGRPGGRVENAIVLQLGQLFCDDRMPVASLDRPFRSDDVADVLRLVVASLDRSLLPANPVASAGGLTLNIDTLRIPTTEATVDLVDGGLEVFVRARDVRIGTSGRWMQGSTNVSLAGSLVATVSASMQIEIHKDSPTAPVTSRVAQFDFFVEDLHGEFTDGGVNALVAATSGALRSAIENAIGNTFRPVLQSTVGDGVGSAFAAIDTALANIEQPLTSAPLPMVTMRIAGGVSAVDLAYRDHLRASIGATFGTTNTSALHPSSRGVAVWETAPTPDLAFFSMPRVQFGLRVAAVNTLFHAVWDSGLLEPELSHVLPMSLAGLITNARLESKLPPIVRLPRPGEGHDLVLELGQMEFEGVTSGVTSRYGVNLTAGLDLSIANNHLSVAIAEQPVVRVWRIARVPDRNTLLTADVLRTAITDTLWPQLRGALGDSLDIAIPIPALDPLARVSPSLRGLRLEVDITDRVTERAGYLLFSGDLAAVLP